MRSSREGPGEGTTNTHHQTASEERKHRHTPLLTWHPFLGRSDAQGTPLLQTKLVAHVEVVAVGEGEAVTQGRTPGRLRVVVALAFVDVESDVTVDGHVSLLALLRVSGEGEMGGSCKAVFN